MFNTKSLLFLLIFFGTKPLGIAQEENKKEIPIEWLKQLSEYRSFLLQKNTNATKELKILFDRWNALEFGEEEQADFTFNVFISSSIHGLSFKSIKKKAIKYEPDSYLAKAFTEEDLSIINKNAALLDLIFLGLLDSEYPFKIDAKTELFQELMNYDIKETDKIGEIGCGSGAFSLVLNLLTPETQLFVNELNSSFLKYISLKKENHKIFVDQINMNFIKGTKKSTNLENYDLDKIIIRNTFHHFSQKKKMLESIKKSLCSNGTLYIMEGTKETADENSCKHLMLQADIINCVEENGFKLVEEVHFSHQVLLKFEMVK